MATLLASSGALGAVKVAAARDVRHVDKEVDWVDFLQQRLPVAQVPREKKLRQEMFKKMDVNKNGGLTLTEVQGGIPPLLEENDHLRSGVKSRLIVPLTDLKPAIKCAFNAARRVAPDSSKAKMKKHQVQKSKAKSSQAKKAAAASPESSSDLVDVREFHALLVAFRNYLELNVLFHRLDKDDDNALSWHEVKQPQCLALLEAWNISPEKAKSKFPDEWTSSMKFEDFAEWCIVRRFGSLKLDLDENDPEETVKDATCDQQAASKIGQVIKAFQEWDQDGDGWISEEELAKVMQRLDPKFTFTMAKKLFQAADTNQDGRVDYVEFVNWITA